MQRIVVYCCIKTTIRCFNVRQPDSEERNKPHISIKFGALSHNLHVLCKFWKQYGETRMDFKINQEERDALKGLPHLPRLTYLEAIRPYMDYATGVVGIKRGISYQSLAEELYIEPHTGYTDSGSPSKQQLRRALKTLERAGLILIQSVGKKLILKCELATWDYSAQNKLGSNPTHQVGTAKALKNNHKTSDYNFDDAQLGTDKNAEPGIPPESGINIIFLEHAFEKFWLMYPNKQSKTQAWKIFQSLSPDAQLFDAMLSALRKQCDHYNIAVAKGQWVPNWKNANNWLAQHCWNEPLFEIQQTGNQHARTQRNYSKQSQSSDLLWDSCKSAFESEDNNSTVIDINAYRSRAH